MEITDHDPFLWLAPELAGDERAYGEYAARLMRDLRCYFAGKGCKDAEDLAAEVLSRLVTKLGHGQPPGRGTELSRRQHVFGFAQMVFQEWRRSQANRGPRLQESAGLQPGVAPFDLIAEECRRLLHNLIRENLSRMSSVEREILLATELAPGYRPTLAGLAKEKGNQPAALRQRASRARRHLRELLSESPRRDDLLRCLGLKRGAA